MDARTEKELILATKPYAKEVRWKSWWHLVSTGVLLAGWYFGIFWPTTPLWLKIIFSILAGLTIARMFIIYHDHQHKAILQNSKLADVLMTIWGIFILAPSSIWKRSHDHHHTHNSKLYTSSIGSYPIVTVEKFNTFTKKRSRSSIHSPKRSGRSTCSSDTRLRSHSDTCSFSSMACASDHS